jgi:hypothetical protein
VNGARSGAATFSFVTRRLSLWEAAPIRTTSAPATRSGSSRPLRLAASSAAAKAALKIAIETA